MRNRTRVIAAAAVTAALAAGSTGAAVASTTGTKPGSHAKTVHGKTVHAKTVHGKTVSPGKRAVDRHLAAQLGVSPARLDQALLQVKTSLSKNSSRPTVAEFYAALARSLGVPQARVRQAIPQGKSGGPKAGASKSAGKHGDSRAAGRLEIDAFSAAVARQLHVSTAQVKVALRPLFVAGHAEPSSPVFAAAARSLGVSSQLLSAAIMHAKESLAAAR